MRFPSNQSLGWSTLHKDEKRVNRQVRRIRIIHHVCIHSLA